jgi:diadenylate cyclase
MVDFITIWKPVIEILILWFVIYQILVFFEGSRAIHVIRGISILLVAFFLFQKLQFEVLDWLLTKLFGISVIAVMIIFHPEIRKGLARLGRRHLFNAILKEEEFEYVLKQIGKAAENLSKDKAGGIIAIENKDSLSAYSESGVAIDARVSAELIESIFARNTLLHDGAMIIQHGRISASGCLFPLTDKPDLSRMFGTRHRAALGLSEETDALIIIISEERQDISLVHQGHLYKDLSREELFSKIKDLIKAS